MAKRLTIQAVVRFCLLLCERVHHSTDHCIRNGMRLLMQIYGGINLYAEIKQESSSKGSYCNQF